MIKPETRLHRKKRRNNMPTRIRRHNGFAAMQEAFIESFMMNHTKTPKGVFGHNRR